MINIGDKFGKLTVVSSAYNEQSKRKGFQCLCDCGKERFFLKDALLRGNNKSCGCLNYKHGMAGTRIYKSWVNLKKRCNKVTCKDYKNYGARGIGYDPKWETFEGFYEDMQSGYADHLTLDRIDVNKNYSKDNCRWADKKTQANNTRSNRSLTYKGETMSMMELSEKYNLNYGSLKSRLKYGWTVEAAVETSYELDLETIVYQGETKTVVEWAQENGMTYHQLKKRLMRGWTVERAITQPLRKRRS